MPDLEQTRIKDEAIRRGFPYFTESFSDLLPVSRTRTQGRAPEVGDQDFNRKVSTHPFLCDDQARADQTGQPGDHTDHGDNQIIWSMPRNLAGSCHTDVTGSPDFAADVTAFQDGNRKDDRNDPRERNACAAEQEPCAVRCGCRTVRITDIAEGIGLPPGG